MKKSVEELEKTLNANKAKKVIPVTIIKPEKVNIEPVNKDILIYPPQDDDDECYGDCDTCPDEYCPAKCYDDFDVVDKMECPLTNECLVCSDENCPAKLTELKKENKKLHEKIDKLKDESPAYDYVETKDELGDLADLSDILPLALGERGAVIKDGKYEVDGKTLPELTPGARDIVEAYENYRKKVDAWMEEHKEFPKFIAKACLLNEYPETPEEAAQLSPNEKLFKSIVTQMFDTYKRKNKDYGASFDELFDEYGMTSALLRIKDKYNRLKAINDNGQIEVKDESVEDTLLDMANYAILTVIKLRNNKSKK